MIFFDGIAQIQNSLPKENKINEDQVSFNEDQVSSCILAEEQEVSEELQEVISLLFKQAKKDKE